jgi:hypothetical protein
MDDKEIARLRKAICRSFGSSPHKKKLWLAVLEMYARDGKTGVTNAAGPQDSFGEVLRSRCTALRTPALGSKDSARS